MKLKTVRADGTEVELELTPEQEKAMEVKRSTKRWRAEVGRKYFKVDYNGESKEYFYNIDNLLYNLGNYYQTQEQAKFARDKQLAIVKINDRIAELNNGIVGDCYIALNEKGALYIAYQDGITLPLILNTIVTVESGCKIIEEFQDDLLKYIFN